MSYESVNNTKSSLPGTKPAKDKINVKEYKEDFSKGIADISVLTTGYDEDAVIYQPEKTLHPISAVKKEITPLSFKTINNATTSNLASPLSSF